jgi:hypothetical protein
MYFHDEICILNLIKILATVAERLHARMQPDLELNC